MRLKVCAKKENIELLLDAFTTAKPPAKMVIQSIILRMENWGISSPAIFQEPVNAVGAREISQLEGKLVIACGAFSTSACRNNEFFDPSCPGVTPLVAAGGNLAW